MIESKIKILVRERDGYRCVECGMTAEDHVEKFGKTLSVHRLIPGSEYTVEGCKTYCLPCHTEEHRRLAAMGVRSIGQRERVRKPARPTKLLRVSLDSEKDFYLRALAARFYTTKSAILTRAIVEAARERGLWRFYTTKSAILTRAIVEAARERGLCE
jgi:hypothetical protein